MNSRESSLKAIRLEIIPNTIKTEMSSEEYFQNSVLRPLIKFQNDLLIAIFLNFINTYKNVFFELSTEKKITYIENALAKDRKLRNSLKNTVIALFTVEEYNSYTTNSSALNKRMIGIIKERLISHIQLLTEIGPTA